MVQRTYPEKRRNDALPARAGGLAAGAAGVTGAARNGGGGASRDDRVAHPSVHETATFRASARHSRRSAKGTAPLPSQSLFGPLTEPVASSAPPFSCLGRRRRPARAAAPIGTAAPPSAESEGQVLDGQVLLDAFRTSLTAQARVLHAPEGGSRVGHHPLVQAHHA